MRLLGQIGKFNNSNQSICCLNWDLNYDRNSNYCSLNDLGAS